MALLVASNVPSASELITLGQTFWTAVDTLDGLLPDKSFKPGPHSFHPAQWPWLNVAPS